MRVLIACESSGVVSQAFRDRGHNAISCDLEKNEMTGNQFHYQGDVRDILDKGWDLMIAHPPCDHLAVAGAKHFKEKQRDGRQQAAADFFMELINAPIPKICVENPIGIMSTSYRKPDQIIQPWWFGDPHTKSTCLWLKNLPLLVSTNIVDKGERHVTKSGKSLPKWYNLPPGPNRAKIRSRTFLGIANAFAEQWG